MFVSVLLPPGDHIIKVFTKLFSGILIEHWLNFLLYLKVLVVHYLLGFNGDFRCQVVKGHGGKAMGGQQR